MNIRHLRPVHQDDRGLIAELFSGGRIERVSYLTTQAGCVRGNHFHPVSTARVFICEGSFLARAREEFGPIFEQIVSKGDLVTFAPGERHSLVAVSDSAFVMMRSYPDGEDSGELDVVKEDV
jgi:quercetin dioxygenase-like cupin family protein